MSRDFEIKGRTNMDFHVLNIRELTEEERQAMKDTADLINTIGIQIAQSMKLPPAYIDAWTKRRNEAFEKFDKDWCRKNGLAAASDEVLEIAMHKARYECTQISREARLQSKRWLRERGCKGMYGIPLLPDDELPE